MNLKANTNGEWNPFNVSRLQKNGIFYFRVYVSHVSFHLSFYFFDYSTLHSTVVDVIKKNPRLLAHARACCERCVWRALSGAIRTLRNHIRFYDIWYNLYYSRDPDESFVKIRPAVWATAKAKVSYIWDSKWPNGLTRTQWPNGIASLLVFVLSKFTKMSLKWPLPFRDR